jgi:hypothetical protein
MSLKDTYNISTLVLTYDKLIYKWRLQRGNPEKTVLLDWNINTGSVSPVYIPV